MLDNIFRGIFDSSTATVIAVDSFLLCLAVSLAIGAFLAFIYTYKSRYTKSFAVTLAMLPAVVCVIIMLVNGNIGAGVAVAGAFSLVRFRSVPGTAREICAIFLAMGAGLVTGMGYLAYGVLFALILGGVNLIYNALSFGSQNGDECDKTLRITIPESLNYSEAFNDLFIAYTKKHELVRVKTSNMGALYSLTYNLTLKNASDEKTFIDALRCRNGNLEISSSRQESCTNEL